MIWTGAGTVNGSRIKNNIFKDCTNPAVRIDNNESKISCDYNLYDVAAVALHSGTTYTTLASWQSHTSQDQNSINDNPDFEAVDDFHLSTGSPAIDGGTDLSITLDYEGNAFGNPTPSFGAYEYMPPNPYTTPVVETAGYCIVGLTWIAITGEVLNKGGSDVTERGFVYGVYENPTTDDNKVVDGSGIGAFGETITGLEMNTTYYLRAYVTNSYGTQYGDNDVYMILKYKFINHNGKCINYNGHRVINY